jgi:hypothetical protein
MYSTTGKYLKTMKTFLNYFVKTYKNIPIDGSYREVKIEREDENNFVVLDEYEYEQLRKSVTYSEYLINKEKVVLNEKERTAVQRAMLAISQIEIAVKTFWGDIYKRMPKPEIGNVGATFAESEVRHADAYSNLIQVLGLNKEFENLLEVPAIRRRIKYLEKSISNSKSLENQDYFESIVLFSMFVENVSLFSQFLVIMSFNKHKNVLKGMSNAVQTTS